MKKLAIIGMVVLGLLLSTSTAWAKPTGMTTAQYQALIARSNGLNKKYGLGTYARPSVSSQLEEIGAWAVPSKQQVTRPDVNQKLEEIGAWAVPSTQTRSTPLVSEKLAGLNLPVETATATGGQGFDWNDAGIGAALALAGVLGIGALLTVRHQHQHRPIPH